MTWPTDRPGVPPHAERDGWHWLMIGPGIGHPFPMLWCADGEMWEAGDDGYVDAADISTRWNYLGPCYTQADLDAAVQAEREACADVAYGIYDDRMTVGEEETAQGAYDAAVSIQARGPTPALDAALAQARREGMEAACATLEARIMVYDSEAETHLAALRHTARSVSMGKAKTLRAAIAAIRSAAGEEGK